MPGHLVKIEVEVDTLTQLEEALGVGVDAVLLDNMALDDLKRAVAMIGGRAISEASGRISNEIGGHGPGSIALTMRATISSIVALSSVSIKRAEPARTRAAMSKLRT